MRDRLSFHHSSRLVINDWGHSHCRMTLRAGMLSESLGLLDLLVLVRARQFTGFAASTFSWMVQVGNYLNEGQDEMEVWKRYLFSEHHSRA